jgi:hypothetical protein
MNLQFQSSITRGGDALTPEKITITDRLVTWSKRNKFLIGVDSISIPLNKIASIELNEKMIGVDITINSSGDTCIIARNFTASDAHEIRKELSK